MKENYRIRFNPVTKEIEIEGSESFVKTYFNKIQRMVPGPVEKTVSAKMTKKKLKETKVSPWTSTKKAANKATVAQRITNIDRVLRMIQKSKDGIATADLKKKTGLSELQIWNIINRTAKAGRIVKLKRGIYGPVPAA